MRRSLRKLESVAGLCQPGAADLRGRADLEERRRIFSGNALRLLALRPGEPGYQRLRDYHRRLAKDFEWLDRLTSVATG